jgi:2-oxoglutarate dehydrogenase E1 component
LRLEELYPFPFAPLCSLLQTFSHIKEVLWVQEEPKNMGAWNHIQNMWKQECFEKYGQISYAGRPESASPATGSYLMHKKQQEHIMWQAFEAKKEER